MKKPVLICLLALTSVILGGFLYVSSIDAQITRCGFDCDAQSISQNVPATMVAGQTYPITVTMRNVGSTDWTCCSGGSPAGNINNSDGFKLGDPRDFNSPFAPDVRFGVPQTTATGQDAVFSFNITAPVAPGSYTAQWRMVNEFDIWFGEATGVTAVNVVAGSTPTPTPIQTPSPSPSSVDPTGWIESADCSNITGWAFDQDNTSASINVELYDGQPGSGGLLVGTFPANILRPSINTTYGITGNHGYDTTTPVSLKTGSNHNIYIYGVNGGTSGQNTLLNGSPVTLNCSAPPVPTPTPQSSGISVINSNIWWPGAGLVKIAFDTVNQVYLAVSGDSGWFFDKDGVPIGNPFKIALENIPNTAWPNVAFGGPATDPTFLVTYVVGDQVTNPKYGRLVRYQAGGSPLIGNRSKIVDVRDSWYTSEKAVLVWSGTKFIVSSPVNLTAGSIGQPYIHSFSMTGAVSAGVSLGDGVNFAVPRGLACATNGICLSVGYTSNGAYGRRFNANTLAPIGPLFYLDNQTPGSQDADAVFNAHTGQFITTWARGGGSAGWADFRIVNTDGSMGPLDLTKSFGPTAGDVKLAYNSGTETTLLISKLDSSASLYAVELGDNGYPIDPNNKIFLGAWDGIIPGYYPGLAADPVNARWLAMWAWIAGGAGYKGALIQGPTPSPTPPPNPQGSCSINNLRWVNDQAREGDTAILEITGSADCMGQSSDLRIYRRYTDQLVGTLSVRLTSLGPGGGAMTAVNWPVVNNRTDTRTEYYYAKESISGLASNYLEVTWLVLPGTGATVYFDMQPRTLTKDASDSCRTVQVTFNTQISRNSFNVYCGGNPTSYHWKILQDIDWEIDPTVLEGDQAITPTPPNQSYPESATIVLDPIARDAFPWVPQPAGWIINGAWNLVFGTPTDPTSAFYVIVECPGFSGRNATDTIDSAVVINWTTKACGLGGYVPPPINPGSSVSLNWSIINPLAGFGGRPPPEDIFGLILFITDWILNIAGSLVVILIIYGGVRFMISRGNLGEIQKAKGILQWALIGFAVVLIGKGFVFIVDSVLRGNIPIP